MNSIFDIEKIRKNRAYALQNMEGHDFLFEKATERMIDNLCDIKRDFKNILIIGARGSEALVEYFSNKNITVYDVVEDNNEIPDLKDESFDCILCLHYLHVVNNVPAFLLKIKSMLVPDGLFLCSFFGGLSLQELRQSIMDAELQKTGGVSQHIHPMIDHYQAAALMQKSGFALPVVDYDRVIVEYGKLETLYQDLRMMGEGNALNNRKSNIKKLKQYIENIYKNKFYNEGYVATFDIIHTIGWAPHESQQKPLERGSGEVSLTEIL